jgi:hypothetical protein
MILKVLTISPVTLFQEFSDEPSDCRRSRSSFHRFAGFVHLGRSLDAEPGPSSRHRCSEGHPARRRADQGAWWEEAEAQPLRPSVVRAQQAPGIEGDAAHSPRAGTASVLRSLAPSQTLPIVT